MCVSGAEYGSWLEDNAQESAQLLSHRMYAQCPQCLPINLRSSCLRCWSKAIGQLPSVLPTLWRACGQGVIHKPPAIHHRVWRLSPVDMCGLFSRLASQGSVDASPCHPIPHTVGKVELFHCFPRVVLKHALPS